MPSPQKLQSMYQDVMRAYVKAHDMPRTHVTSSDDLLARIEETLLYVGGMIHAVSSQLTNDYDE